MVFKAILNQFLDFRRLLFKLFLSLNLSKMEQIANEISNLNLKIDAIEQLLDKDYEEWTQKEKQKFGNHDQLRKKEEQLRELLILKEKQNHQLQGISKPTAGTAAYQGIAQQSTKNIQKPARFLYSSGPVDPKINYPIPFDTLPWNYLDSNLL